MTGSSNPIYWRTSKCQTKAGRYSNGQSVLLNCTQTFDAIPVGYFNVIGIFANGENPYGIYTKTPLSSLNLQN
jgi:hypothetical protein